MFQRSSMMVDSNSLSTNIARSALQRLSEARRDEPNPLHSSATEVVRFVREMQKADLSLNDALSGNYNTLLLPEREVLERRRASIDAAIARQVSLAARRMGANREEALDTLNGIFKLGSAPDPSASGRHRGQLTTSTLFAPLDSYGRFMSRLYMPWKGKRFDAQSSSG